MLKITPRSSDNSSPTLALEGRLVGPWIEELERVWKEFKDSTKGALVVDLTGVTFIEAEGKVLLGKMWREGAEFRAAGCLTKCIVEEIAKTDRGGSSRSS